MNIGLIRSHLEMLIAIVDPDIIILEDSFDDREITSSESETGYKITFGINTNTRGSNSYVDVLPFKIAIYEPSNRNEQQSFDDIYTKAYAIRNQIIDPQCGLDEYTEIISTNITPSVLDTSDKTIKMELEFEIRNDFSFL